MASPATGNSTTRIDGDKTEIIAMAMPQRDNTIEELKRLDALLEYAVMHGDEAEAERIREKLRNLAEEA